MLSNRLVIGKKGEKIAKKFLKKKKLKFLTSNFIYKNKEVDLIFEDLKNKILIFVEVKTRLDDSIATPEDNINLNKLKKYNIAINGFLLKNPKYKDYGIRIDSIGIVLKRDEILINHTEAINQIY
ncbi:MAG: YraN family protein [Ignavibacteria bacterium]|nr:YraN family protein [Ignavibacteria bacterium]